MVCKQCPARKHCWDKGACEDCDFSKAFYALERKIGRLKKKNAELIDLITRFVMTLSSLKKKSIPLKIQIFERRMIWTNTSREKMP